MQEELENKDLCAQCGGDCCKKSGCDYTPSDFPSLEKNSLLGILEEGNISITSFLKFNFINTEKILAQPMLYLRARNSGRSIIDLISIKTPCSMLLENGCSYSLENRPSCGVNFIPKPNRECYAKEDPLILMKPWERYQRVLERLVKRYTGLSVDAKIKEDVETLFCDIYSENYETIHPREVEDLNELLPILMRVYPEQYQQASNKCRQIIPVIKVKK